VRLFVAAFMLAVLWWLSEALVRFWPLTLGAAALLAVAGWWDLRQARR